MSLDSFNHVIGVNVTAVFQCCQEAIKIMKEQTPPGGRYVAYRSLYLSVRRYPLDDPQNHQQRLGVRSRTSTVVGPVHHVQTCHLGVDQDYRTGLPALQYRLLSAGHR